MTAKNNGHGGIELAVIMNILYSHEMDTRNTTLHQGQVRGYGRITRILPLPEEDHDFYKATLIQQMPNEIY